MYNHRIFDGSDPDDVSFEPFDASEIPDEEYEESAWEQMMSALWWDTRQEVREYLEGHNIL